MKIKKINTGESKMVWFEHETKWYVLLQYNQDNSQENYYREWDNKSNINDGNWKDDLEEIKDKNLRCFFEDVEENFNYFYYDIEINEEIILNDKL